MPGNFRHRNLLTVPGRIVDCTMVSPPSSTIRTARARTSGENLFVVLLIMAPLSQELEPPAIPGRFIPSLPRMKAGRCLRIYGRFCNTMTTPHCSPSSSPPTTPLRSAKRVNQPYIQQSDSRFTETAKVSGFPAPLRHPLHHDLRKKTSAPPASDIVL